MTELNEYRTLVMHVSIVAPVSQMATNSFGEGSTDVLDGSTPIDTETFVLRTLTIPWRSAVKE